MRKIAMIAIPITIFVAGLLLGTWGLADQKTAEASVPAQVERGSGWAVENFQSITFEQGQWDQLGQVGSGVIYQAFYRISSLKLVSTKWQNSLLGLDNPVAQLVKPIPIGTTHSFLKIEHSNMPV